MRCGARLAGRRGWRCDLRAHHVSPCFFNQAPVCVGRFLGLRGGSSFGSDLLGIATGSAYLPVPIAVGISQHPLEASVAFGEQSDERTGCRLEVDALVLSNGGFSYATCSAGVRGAVCGGGGEERERRQAGVRGWAQDQLQVTVSVRSFANGTGGTSTCRLAWLRMAKASPARPSNSVLLFLDSSANMVHHINIEKAHGSTVRLLSATFRVPIAVTGNCIREPKQQ